MADAAPAAAREEEIEKSVSEKSVSEHHFEGEERELVSGQSRVWNPRFIPF
jgi:hypothetical protein